MKGWTERRLIGWIRRQAVCRDLPREVTTGPGDDAAVLRVVKNGSWVVTTDSIVEGIDYLPGGVSPRRIGRKALAVSLSDIAAMGCQARHALVAAVFPRSLAWKEARGVLDGVFQIARQFRVSIIGGDLSATRGPLVLTTTVLGTPVSPRGPVCRSGAKPGDLLFVTGSLGGSIAGKHLSFRPRLQEARWLCENAFPRAMIDLSDGLAADLGHLMEESGTGAVLDSRAIPVSSAAGKLSRSTGRTALEHALEDGEDFELLFAVSPRSSRTLSAPRDRRAGPRDRRAGPRDRRAGGEVPFRTTLVGTVVKGTGLRLRTADGRLVPLATKGFEHTFGGKRAANPLP